MVEKCRKIQQIYYALLWALIREITRRNSKVLGRAKVSIQELVTFVTAVAHPCVICLHLRTMLLGKSSDLSQSATQWSDKKAKEGRQRRREGNPLFDRFFLLRGITVLTAWSPARLMHEMLAHVQRSTNLLAKHC